MKLQRIGRHVPASATLCATLLAGCSSITGLDRWFIAQRYACKARRGVGIATRSRAASQRPPGNLPRAASEPTGCKEASWPAEAQGASAVRGAVAVLAGIRSTTAWSAHPPCRRFRLHGHAAAGRSRVLRPAGSEALGGRRPRPQWPSLVYASDRQRTVSSITMRRQARDTLCADPAVTSASAGKGQSPDALGHTAPFAAAAARRAAPERIGGRELCGLRRGPPPLRAASIDIGAHMHGHTALSLFGGCR